MKKLTIDFRNIWKSPGFTVAGVIAFGVGCVFVYLDIIEPADLTYFGAFAAATAVLGRKDTPTPPPTQDA
jgi:hypothetical protein